MSNDVMKLTSAAIEGNTERLEALLAGSVPDLQRNELVVDLVSRQIIAIRDSETHHDFLCQEIGSNCGLKTAKT